MKKYFVCLSLLACIDGMAQEIRVNTGIGMAIASTPEWKKPVWVSSFQIGYECPSRRKLYGILGFQFTQMKYGFDQTAVGQAFYTSRFFSVPIMARNYLIMSGKSNTRLYIDFGIQPQFGYHNRVEIRANQTKRLQRQAVNGFSTGAIIQVGYKRPLDSFMEIELGFGFGSDIWASRSAKDRIVWQENRQVLQVNFTRKL